MRTIKLSLIPVLWSVLALLPGTAPAQTGTPQSSAPHPWASVPQPNTGGPADAAGNSGPGNSGVNDSAPVPDEPGKAVARLSVLSGEASIRRGDSQDAVAAALNAPVMGGDALAVGHNAAVELQFDSAHFARFAGDTDAQIAGMDGTAGPQIQISRGLVTWRVLRNSTLQAEVQTPLVSVRPVGLASVRVEVTGDGGAKITVRHGEAEVRTAKGAERVRTGDLMIVRGTAAEPEFQVVRAPAIDQWDDWSDKRDGYLTRSTSPAHVSADIVGAEDLDNYGRWANDPAYGDVWIPTVPATWAPYREGRWVWQDYYGWTWVDYAPWGWAPFHYGSWYWRTGWGWAWYPGPRYGHYWYRPALVGFVGFGGGFGVGFGYGGIGWVPLGPFERYHPWYGRGWYGGRNVVVNNINIVHNTNITNVYRNARVANGVTGVSSSDFQQGNFRNRTAVTSAQLSQASLVRGAVPMTPNASHLAFSDRAATVAARPAAGNQRFFGSQYNGAASSGRVPFSQQQSAVNSAFQSRGIQTGSAGPGQRFGSPSAAQGGAAGGSAGWNRFGSGSANGGQPGAGRSLNVQPPIVRQRPASTQTFGNGSEAPGRQFGAQRAPPAAPQYRPAPQQAAPQYRPAPAPQQRSAPAPSAQPRSSGGGGGGSRPSGGGGHATSGGHRR
jgi:hypothetical protein